MKTILNFLKSCLMIGVQQAPAIIGAYNPLLGALASNVLSAVVQAEGLIGPKQGDIKRNVSAALLTAKGADIAAIFDAAGKPIKNADLFAAGVSKIQEGIVDILNATGDAAKE